MTTLRVAALGRPGAGVRSLALLPADGTPASPYAPGSALVLRCGPPSGAAPHRAYSLTGDGVAPSAYEVSVLRLGAGSAWLHGLRVGDEVAASGPACDFGPVATARRHLLVAGGIGITPVLAHVRAARVWGRDVRVLYAYRPGRGAHLPELRELLGERLSEHPDRGSLAAALEARLAASPLGTHALACGPPGLLDLVRGRALALGWPAERVHTEAFTVPVADPGTGFEVVLARSGRRLPVPAGSSVLEVLEAAGAPVPSLCRAGVCGRCRVGVLAGRPLHRDLHLDERERAAGDCLLSCVSRSAGGPLELDL